MTPSRPKNKKLNLLIIIAGSALLSISLSNVFVYNKVVNLQQMVAQKEKEAGDLRLTNADLKNKFYTLIDAKNLTELSLSRGLIKVRSPEYLEVNPVTNSQIIYLP